jgi:hypothetical protein
MVPAARAPAAALEVEPKGHLEATNPQGAAPRAQAAQAAAQVRAVGAVGLTASTAG